MKQFLHGFRLSGAHTRATLRLRVEAPRPDQWLHAEWIFFLESLLTGTGETARGISANISMQSIRVIVSLSALA